MKRIYSKIVLISLLLVSITGSVYARECTECMKVNAKNAAVRTKAAGCKRAQSTAELNINNVRALINGYGNMWFDGTVTQYHIPANENTSPLYCAALWIGGTDVNDQLRLAALRFGQVGDDFWPGPLKIHTASIETETCNQYDKHWIITQAEVLAHRSKFKYNEDGEVEEVVGDVTDIPDVIANWPAKGDGDDLTRYLAPFYDADGDQEYNPANGDYPYYDFDNHLCPRKIKAENPGQNYVTTPTYETSITHDVTGGILSDQVLKGDQTIWWVFNDMGNTHTETKGSPIGLEIRAQAFAFSTNDEINNMTFYSYEIINRSTYELRETYFSQWVDPDLGDAYDDYVGCDVRRGLGYCYNGDEQDGPSSGSYSGVPPAVGIDFFQGPYMDPDGKDNPKIDIPYILSPENSNTQLRDLLEKYKKTDENGRTYYDTIAITDDADLFFKAGETGYKSWYFHPGDAVGNCAINGVNFGNNIIDDERFGMRRFVYYNNKGSGPNSEPSQASDYYNYLRGIWKDNTRMKYGGNAVKTASSTNVSDLDCDFMFPYDTDPWHWGTNGEIPGEEFLPNSWNERNVGNAADDRRFMQSAGPFTLKPGAVNYITVGIPFAQASSGNAWTSVELLCQIDDVCQALFENCFSVLDGPEAPTVTCQELENEIILYLHYDNVNSNNYNEKYVSDPDPRIVSGYTKEHEWNGVRGECFYEYGDRSYHFEGYQIFQLKDASVSISDVYNFLDKGDDSKVKLVDQCDIKNYYDTIILTEKNGECGFDTAVNPNPSQPIANLVNFTTNSQTGLTTGSIMVRGKNAGVRHVFRITEDLFATGRSTKLANNREYYFIAVAYAQNRFKEYSQSEKEYLDGQKQPYLMGRKNEWGGTIERIVCIPHSPAVEDGGKQAQAEFGMCPNIVRLEGFGNGGSMLRLTDASLQELMGAPGEQAKQPGTFVPKVSNRVDVSYMTDPCIISNPSYEENYGPVNVRVIDPLKIHKGDYNILFWNEKAGSSKNDTAAGITEMTRWCVVRADGGHLVTTTNADGEVEYQDTIWSDFTISRENEQLFLDLGIAITLVNSSAVATDNQYNNGTYFGGAVNQDALLGATMSFADENIQWLSGVPDNDASLALNWIRSGNQFAGENYSTFYGGTDPVSLNEVYLDEDYFKQIVDIVNNRNQNQAFDKNQVFEKVISGLWAPYGLVSTMPFHPGFNLSYYTPTQETIDSLNSRGENLNLNVIKRRLMTNFYNKAINYNDFTQLPSVRIVFTADTTKWTRCPVIEECDDYTQAEGEARKFSARKHKSVDKLGRTVDDIEGLTADINNPNNPAYIAEYGMGWFPGYAINTITGERLNIMFGEDSRYIQYNGRDMIWNPVSDLTVGSDSYIMGGRHFIYVMNACNQPFANLLANPATKEQVFFRTPSYDAGRWAIKMLGCADRIMKLTSNQHPPRYCNGVIEDEIAVNAVRDSLALLYASVAWVNMPMANARYQFNYPGHNAEKNIDCPSDGIPCDLTIDIDVRMPYGRYMSGNKTASYNCGLSNVNGNMPAYMFKFTDQDAVLESLATKKNAQQEYIDSLLGMINVVPNPYYSYSEYETATQLETKVRIINLPTGVNDAGEKAGCTVKIYTLDGTLVRALGPTTPNVTTLDWDLHNHTGIPIAGGMYLIHVSVPGIGERVIKWFGTMRPVDLNSFQF